MEIILNFSVEKIFSNLIYMRKIIISLSAFLFLLACDTEDKKRAKIICAGEARFAQTETAAKYVFEACMLRRGF